MSRKAVAALAAKLALSISLLWLVLAKVNVESVLGALSQADPWLVVLWYLLFPVVLALSAWRWEILAPGLDFRTAHKYTWIGVFYGHVLPGSIAGDVAKGVSLALKDSAARTGLASSIVAEKVIGLAALLLFFDGACVVAYFHGDESPQVRHLAALAFVLSLVAVAGAVAAALVALRSSVFSARGRSSVLGRLAEGIGSAARFYSNKPVRLAKAFAISMAIHVVSIVATYLSFLALRVDAGWLLAAVIYPVVSVILLVPISISGVGVRDATFAVLFALFGHAAASGVALSWLALLAVIPNIVIGGTIQLFEMYRKP